MVHIKDYIKDMARLDHILKVFFEEGFGEIIHKLNLRHRVRARRKSQKSDTTRVRLRRAFEKLGPTFIMFGQFLSARPDLVPKEFTKELEKLKEHEPLIHFPKIKRIVETELGDSIGHVFKTFEENPLVTTSIAQVHRAELLSGHSVVVKLHKPHIRELIAKDLDIMFVMAHMLDRMSKFKNYDVLEIVREFASWTQKELDFNLEAENMEKFRYNLQDYNVIIPKVFQKLSTSKLLVMEFENAEHLCDHKFSSNKETTAFIQNFANIMCRMVFEDGNFIGDPNEGNMFITKGGRLILLNFGMVGTLDENQRNTVSEIFISLLDKDTKQATEKILLITRKQETARIASYKAKAAQIVQDKPKGKCSIIMTFYDLVREGAKRGIVFPADLILLAKSFMNLEVIAIHVSPEASIQKMIKPYIRRTVIGRYNPASVIEKSIKELKSNIELYANLPVHISELLVRIDKGEVNFHLDDDELREVEGTISRSANKEALAIIITALLITSPIFFYLDIDFLGFNVGIFEIMISFILLVQLLFLMKKRK